MTDINKEQMEQLVRDLEARRKTGMNLHASDYALHYDSEKAITSLLQEREEVEDKLDEVKRELSECKEERGGWAMRAGEAEEALDSTRQERDALRAELEDRDKQKPTGWLREWDGDESDLGNMIYEDGEVLPADGYEWMPVFARPVAPAQVIPEWISVEDRLPSWEMADSGERVLALTMHHDFAGVQYHDIPAMYFYSDDENCPEVVPFVTHWMPLPAAPTPLEEKK